MIYLWICQCSSDSSSTVCLRTLLIHNSGRRKDSHKPYYKYNYYHNLIDPTWITEYSPISNSSAPVIAASSAAVVGESPSANALNQPPSIATCATGICCACRSNLKLTSLDLQVSNKNSFQTDLENNLSNSIDGSVDGSRELVRSLLDPFPSAIILKDIGRQFLDRFNDLLDKTINIRVGGRRSHLSCKRYRGTSHVDKTRSLRSTSWRVGRLVSCLIPRALIVCDLGGV